LSVTADVRLRRLRMRSWRRGTREMDLILGRFAVVDLAGLAPGPLDDYERFLSENDHDLYRWISGGECPPEKFRGLVDQIRHRIGMV
jgi:antitoxin CptB